MTPPRHRIMSIIGVARGWSVLYRVYMYCICIYSLKPARTVRSWIYMLNVPFYLVTTNFF